MNHFPKRRKAAKMGVKDAPQVRCPGHLKWIRGHECAIASKHDCAGRIEAAHVRSGTDGGLGVKPSDYWTLPLCSDAHRRQHDIGEKQFEREFEINMKDIAKRFAAASPHRFKWLEG